MIRSGNLPDIIAEVRVDLSEASLHRLFVDILEFPGLVPSYSRLLDQNEAVHTQGEHVAPAIALLDVLFSDDAAAIGANWGIRIHRTTGIGLPGISLPTHPVETSWSSRGVRIPIDDDDLTAARMDAVVSLRTHIESQIANFMIGRRRLSEYEDFVGTALRMRGVSGRSL